jgi:dipeptidyl aminopeptidase/acylaminoacyl peptidase
MNAGHSKVRLSMAGDVAGYAVIMIDFHGSAGYGQAFTDTIRGQRRTGPR